MPTVKTCIIVGASHAGVQAAESLRRSGHQGEIVLIGAEPQFPYQRPPLSKKYLSGELPIERMAIRQPRFYDQQRVTLRLGQRVTSIVPSDRRVEIDTGERLGYDSLLLCVGARVRSLTCPGAHLDGVHYVRSMHDLDRLRSELRAGQRLAVIGAGYIGLEVAATARSLGAEVTVLEMADRCLNRVTCPIVSEFFAHRHAQAGVRILTGQRVASLQGNGRVENIVCEGGTQVACDLVVVGIGIVPDCDLALSAGLTCDNGIVVDEFCRTSVPDIFAAGDCTNHPSVRYGGRGRLESVDNAVEQARVAASNVCGTPTPHAHTPWFWSDQYDVKLQTAGLLHTSNRQIVRGDPTHGAFSVWYFKDRELLAVDAINRPGDFIVGKRWIGERKQLDPERVADVGVELKELVQEEIRDL